MGCHCALCFRDIFACEWTGEQLADRVSRLLSGQSEERPSPIGLAICLNW